MTDDLVARLREEVESECLDTMMLEAANRIERLETALQEIAATPISLEVPDRTTIWGLAMHMHWVAKDALKEKKND
jgi:hypothetical protein